MALAIFTSMIFINKVRMKYIEKQPLGKYTISLDIIDFKRVLDKVITK